MLDTKHSTSLTPMALPPSYKDACQMQMPPPPYMPQRPVLSTYYDGTCVASVQPPEADRDGEDSQRGTLRRYLKSWTTVLREGRWTFLGCSLCCILLIGILITVVSFRPNYQHSSKRVHAHHRQ